MMDGLPDFARDQLGIKARMITGNPYIKLDPEHLTDDNIKLLNKHLSDNTLHTAIGALLFMGSTQFAQDQQIEEMQVAKQNWFKESLVKITTLFAQFSAWIRRVF